MKQSSNFEELYLINTPEEFMEYLKSNYQYGWIDINNKIHLNTMDNCRQLYQISSLDEILENKIGTCIEQVKLANYFFNLKNIENKIFCSRRKEYDDNFGKVVFLHCMIIFKREGLWYQLEHASKRKNGIHKFNSLEEAIDKLSCGVLTNKLKAFTELPYIPDHITIKDFNIYMNSLDDQKVKSLKK